MENMAGVTPDCILFAQHGWADNGLAIADLARRVATPTTHIVAPSLNYLDTWLRIHPLIQATEALAIETLATYPTLPIRIIGHSMGGLIWLEVLHRHPEWWSRVESIVLIASPVGGADLARLLDPFGWGIGISRDLSISRRTLAEAIAPNIPILVIAGDVDQGSDGTIPVGSTHFFGAAQWVCLADISHAALKNHPLVAETIQQFWAASQSMAPASQSLQGERLIRCLQQIPGMTDAHPRDFAKATVYLTLPDGLTIRVWKNPLGLEHVFVGCPNGQCLYGGFVSWIHSGGLWEALREIQQTHTKQIAPVVR